jgi:hypothetical protein
MSRLIDKLTSMRKAEPRSMGFAMNRPAVEKPKMQLIAGIAAGNPDKVSAALSPVDAVLIEVEKAGDLKAVKKLCQAKDGVPAGGWLKVNNDEILQDLTEGSCDFAVFLATSPVAVTDNEKIGRIMELDATIGEGLLRTVNDLPLDAVLVSGIGAENRMTLDRLMSIRRLTYIISKPILVSIPDSLSVSELQALWDMGVSGVFVESVNEESAGKLAALRQSIDKLTPPSDKKKGKTTAILPQMQAEAAAPQEDEGDDDGEEEDE